MTGVRCSRVLAVMLAVLAAATIATATGLAGSVQLDKLVLRASQVGSGYKLVQRSDGRGVKGFVTLDMCGYRFTSEADRTGRLQVNYVRPHTAIKFSNEVVSYAAGGTQLAMRELNDAVRHCPKGPVASTVRGVPPLTYRLTRLSTVGLLPGALALRVKVSGTYKGRRFAETDAVVYQVHGNILSGLYVYGGSVTNRERAALRVGRKSGANLLG